MKSKRLLPKGIGVRYTKQDGTVIDVPDPYLKRAKYPNSAVNSIRFKTLPSWERLFLLSLEFLNSARLMCKDAGEKGKGIRWTQGSISFFCLHMATELFLKSCIKRANKITKLNHSIGELYRTYCDTFAGEHFRFPTPWGISGCQINQIIGLEVITGIDLNTDQVYRYFEDKNGNPPTAIHFFSPGYQLNYIIDLEKRWKKIQAEIGRQSS